MNKKIDNLQGALDLLRPRASMQRYGIAVHFERISDDALSTPSLFGAARSASPKAGRREGLAWALGWGAHRSAVGNTYFHVGAEPGFENYAACFVDRKTGYVLLSSGKEFGGVVRTWRLDLIGDTVSPLDWLGY